MWKALTACLVLGFGSAASNALAGEPSTRPAETRYEVYFFHASWRCANCNNAEAWTREFVQAIAEANDMDAVAFAPVEIEKNEALAKEAKAKRVDVAVVEIVNGKRTRLTNLGNLLPIIFKERDNAKSKAEILKMLREGIKDFDAKAKTPWLVIPEPPESKPGNK